MSRIRFTLCVLSVICLTGSASAQIFSGRQHSIRNWLNNHRGGQAESAVTTAAPGAPMTPTTITPPAAGVRTSGYTPATSPTTPPAAVTGTTMPVVTTSAMPQTASNRSGRLHLLGRRRGGSEPVATAPMQTTTPPLAPAVNPSPMPKPTGTAPGTTTPPTTIGSTTPTAEPAAMNSTRRGRHLLAGRFHLFGRGRYSS
jgi:hypothetical protein